MAQARGLVQCVMLLVGAWLFLAWTFLHSHHDSVVDTAAAARAWQEAKDHVDAAGALRRAAAPAAPRRVDASAPRAPPALKLEPRGAAALGDLFAADATRDAAFAAQALRALPAVPKPPAVRAAPKPPAPKPPPKPPADGCTWRDCFGPKPSCLAFCRLEPPTYVALAPDGWVPDPTALRKKWLARPTELDDALCEDYSPMGGRGDDSNKRMLREGPIEASPFETRSGPKLLCLVYTMAENHASNVRAIAETWAPGCDGFVAFSTASDPALNAISIPHDGREEYNNMWQKVRSMWKYVAAHYLDQYDWFFIGGEDLYVIPQNLRDYLATRPGPETPQFLGRRFRDYGNVLFNSGGAGYALSRSALQAYAAHAEDARCAPAAHTPQEDVQVAKCLKKILGIEPDDTRDASGRERFHPFAPGHMLTIRPPAKGQHDWYYDYNKEWGVLPGKMCCAPDSVSFHYLKKPAMVRHVHKLLYDRCPHR